ncbi:uncharacterized protein tp53i13 [Hippocampus zosterae]|uniref:uncharacterized protein tp53i13 n=1 Tax=Hippocampus zosterae TaxID=109293 RepID=UPI00223DA0EC|nr:uncharacterized protein tp53i13 [Hippocampus zosterae]
MPNHTVAVLAALWFFFGRYVNSEHLTSDCDNGKLLLERDLPTDAIYWGCPTTAAWYDSTQRLPSVDTVYDPELAWQVCMTEPISYRHSIPNSGAFRPVRAQSGEYLYCPPQRWLNNLHHGAAVLLYHPCAAFSERALVSILARSCLHDYIVTPHPQLNKSMPVALVAWGRTLELSTAASSDVCDWLQSTTTSGSPIRGKYNFLLTRATNQHGYRRTRREGRRSEPKESVRQCCEQIISSWPKGKIKAEKKKVPPANNRNGQEPQGESRQRQERAAIPAKQDDVKLNGTFHMSDVLRNRKNSSTHGPRTHWTGTAVLTNQSGLRKGASPTKIQNQDLSSRPATPFGSRVSGPTQRILLIKVPETDGHRAAATSPTVKQGVSAKHSANAGRQTQENEVVDLRETESAQKADMNSLKRRDESVAPKHIQQERRSDPATTDDCDTCTTGQQSDCVGDSECQATFVSSDFLRTPRSDEAVWAGAALGFLLVLLTLSVLHTRLYRHWRTMPSLYWHDPQQDYESVADVIHRRMQIQKRRRKRGRRQECALLLSSSSSDEYI